MTKVSLLCFFLLLLGACSRQESEVPVQEPEVPMQEPEVSVITIACIGEYNIEIGAPVVFSDSIDLPKPVVTTNCSNPDLTYTLDVPSELQEGVYQVTMHVTDACGAEAMCSFEYRISYDFRDQYIGKYTGKRKCGWQGSNGSGQYPESTIQLTVAKSQDPDYIEVKEYGDVVFIDSTGKFPYPSLAGYRFYALQFKPGGLSIYQQWGIAGHQEYCSFVGKKQ